MNGCVLGQAERGVLPLSCASFVSMWLRASSMPHCSSTWAVVDLLVGTPWLIAR
jgi:hypothetical protein